MDEFLSNVLLFTVEKSYALDHTKQRGRTAVSLRVMNCELSICHAHELTVLQSLTRVTMVIGCPNAKIVFTNPTSGETFPREMSETLLAEATCFAILRE